MECYQERRRPRGAKTFIFSNEHQNHFCRTSYTNSSDYKFIIKQNFSKYLDIPFRKLFSSLTKIRAWNWFCFPLVLPAVITLGILLLPNEDKFHSPTLIGDLYKQAAGCLSRLQIVFQNLLMTPWQTMTQLGIGNPKACLSFKVWRFWKLKQKKKREFIYLYHFNLRRCWSDHMPSTDRMTSFTLQVRTYFWVTI